MVNVVRCMTSRADLPVTTEGVDRHCWIMGHAALVVRGAG